MPGTKQVNVGSLKVGQYVMIDGVPCAIVDISVSKPGKHGGAKARVVGIGIFEKVKKEFVAPTSSKVEVPIIDRRRGQVLALMGDMVQIMDLETYEQMYVSANTLDKKVYFLKKGWQYVSFNRNNR